MTHEKQLIEACKTGDLPSVKKLVENGADIHSDNDFALRNASENGQLEVVRYLVENDADIHAKDDLALRNASENGHIEVVRYLQNQVLLRDLELI